MITSTARSNASPYDTSAFARPATLDDAFELIAAARILLYTAGEALDTLAPRIAAADVTHDLANQLGDVIDAGRLAVTSSAAGG